MVTESLLHETQRAAQLAQPYLLRSCTPETEISLNRIAIGIEPIRIINLFRHNKLMCSSYGAAEPEREKINAEDRQRLILSTDDYISPGVPVMILRTRNSELLMFSAYEPKTIVTITFAQFALIFISFWWEVAGWLDDTLLKMAYDSITDFTKSVNDGWVMNIVLGTMYIVFPLGWFATIGLDGSQNWRPGLAGNK
ncbi:hypothetical protein S726_004083 [Salmonella enterica subsp. enterica]|nr:hypothetical protein [Salmonella enterica subsp. enterica]